MNALLNPNRKENAIAGKEISRGDAENIVETRRYSLPVQQNSFGFFSFFDFAFAVLQSSASRKCSPRLRVNNSDLANARGRVFAHPMLAIRPFHITSAPILYAGTTA
ncbi:MAG: hypothetical protein ABI852_18465 [Gemmatimonadaceae bacterium]